jgi:hypothetical protein
MPIILIYPLRVNDGRNVSGKYSLGISFCYAPVFSSASPAWRSRQILGLAAVERGTESIPVDIYTDRYLSGMMIAITNSKRRNCGIVNMNMNVMDFLNCSIHNSQRIFKMS